jgi:hypothetical protein
MMAWKGLSGFAVKWLVVGRPLSSRWWLGALVTIVGALGFTLLGWLLTPSSAAAAPLLPAVPVPTLAVPGVATVTPGMPAQPSVEVSSPLADASVTAPAGSSLAGWSPAESSPAVPSPGVPAPTPSDAPVASSVPLNVPAVLSTVRSVSEAVPGLPVAAGAAEALVTTQLRHLTTLVESIVGAALPQTPPRMATAPLTNRPVTLPARHRVSSAQAVSISAVFAPEPPRPVPAIAAQQKPNLGHGPLFPVPAPLSSSCVSGGHGGTPAAAILAAPEPRRPFAGRMEFGADQVGADDDAVRPGVTPD